MAGTGLTFEAVTGKSFVNKHNGATRSVKVIKATCPNGSRAYIYRVHMNEDMDGASNAYGWDNPTNIFPEPYPHKQRNLKPLESHRKGGQIVGLANATRPHEEFSAGTHEFEWVGVYSRTPDEAATALRLAGNPNPPPFALDTRDRLRDTNGRFPVVQGDGQPEPGYYVSQSGAAADPDLKPWNQYRYHDAAKTPYCVMAEGWRGLGVDLGDCGLAIREATGASSPFMFADTGTQWKLGESSHKLFRALSPNGYNEDFVSFIVFPGSGMNRGRKMNSSTIELLVRTYFLKFITASDPFELVRLLALDNDLDLYRKRVAANASLWTDLPVLAPNATNRQKRRYAARQLNSAPLQALRILAALKSWGLSAPLDTF